MTLTDMLAFVSTAILARFEGPRPDPEPEPTLSLAEYDARIDALERRVDELLDEERRVDELLDENRRLQAQIHAQEMRHRLERDLLARRYITEMPPQIMVTGGGAGGPLTVGVGRPLVARQMDEATQRRLMNALNSQAPQAMMEAQQIMPMLDFCNCVPARHDAFLGVMLGDISE